MKKTNNKGFVLAETLVVTLFLLTIFTMLYSYFYPLIGEYNKREYYDDIDSKYGVYWLKRMIEDPSYTLDRSVSSNDSSEELKKQKKANFDYYGYVRFECRNIAADDHKREMCAKLVNELQINNCDENGNYCDIFITKYRIGGNLRSFKETVKNNHPLWYDDCDGVGTGRQDAYCVSSFFERCYEETNGNNQKCSEMGEKKVFDSGLADYLSTLPDYAAPSLNGSKYRVIAVFKHTKDNNNYNTYANIEVSR